MKYILLQSKNKQVWLVNCKLLHNRLFIGYGYIGYVDEQIQQLYSSLGKNTLSVKLSEELLNQYGCSQFNFYLDCESV